RNHRDGAIAELVRGGHCRRRGAILDRARRVGALELEEEPADAEHPSQRWRLQERRSALAEGHEVRRIADRKDGMVAPYAPSGEGRARTPASERPEIVDGLEEPAASRTGEAIRERLLGSAIDAPEAQRA